ncbi:MAG: hypothetical protein WC350_01305 [Candidatus Micrarchaeia archaeon]|jgi:hypothetical protein
MALETRTVGKGPVVGVQGAAAIRSAGEAYRRRITGGSCTERFVLEIEIARNPEKRVRMKDCGYPEYEIRRAAGNIARCWLMVGQLGEGMEKFKKQAEMLREKADVLMKTYGLAPSELAANWGK